MAILADIRPAVCANLRSLRDRNTGRIRRGDVLIVFIFPVAIGTICGYFALFPRDANPLLTIISILAGLSFALAVFVFELRLTASTKYSRGSSVLELIDRFFNSVLYSVITGIASALLCFGTTVTVLDGIVFRVLSGLAAAVTAHYIVTLFISLNRLRKAYNEMTR